MGQTQSDSNVRSSRGRNAATSANRLSSDPSTDERRSSARRSSRMQAKLFRRMTDNSLRLNRRSRAVRKNISSFGKPKASFAQVDGGNQLVQADVPEVSSHRSAWRKSIGFVKSRRWHKAPDHSISNDNDAPQDIDSSAGLPISEALTSSSNSHTPISLPPSGLDFAASSSSPPLGNISYNPDTAILNSPDLSISAPPLLAPAASSEVDTHNTSTTHSEPNISSSHAVIAPSVDNETETTDPVVIVTAEEPISIAPANNDANTDAVLQHVADSLEPNSTSTASETTPIAPRQQFPPSGTLVVVQGVVHTTDIQLPSEPLQSPPTQTQTQNPPSNTEAPHSPDNLRTVRRASSSISSGPRGGRLSALLRRSHGSSSRPGSSSSALDSNGIGSMNEATVDVRQPEGPEALDLRSASPSAPSQPRNQRGTSSGSISSSSIDVLGTLLSVAAAATAASLLTGSSNITPSTDLTPSSTSTAQASSSLSSPGSTHPASEVPPSIAFSSSYPSSSSSTTSPLMTSSNPAHTDLAGDRDRAERIRQLWSAVRNRLGIGHGQSSNRRADSDLQPLQSSDASGDTSAMNVGPVLDAHNARERMLNEIARAFNLGFSSTPSPSVNNNPTNSENENQEHSTGRAEEDNSNSGLPSEGTFERFLLDLQVDLRSVLAGGGDVTNSREQEPATQAEAGTLASRSDGLPFPEPEPEDDSDEDSSPSLHDISDSDDDTNSHRSDSSSSDSLGFISPTNEATQQRTTVSETPNGLPGLRPRINYWRLHRFPPIPAARAHAAADNVAQNMRSGLGGLTRSATLASTGAPRSSTSTNGGQEAGAGAASTMSPNPAPAIAGNSSVVVPVIIVGLQSVNPFWVLDTTTAPMDALNENPILSRTDDPLRSNPTPTTSSALQDTNSLSASSSTSPAGMTSQGTQTQNSIPPPTNSGIPLPFPDSRTFLIYVIGGYYPPDHEIVTGTGESGVMDSSFEALLLLNELLNHAPLEMPVTVSKEQLEKSSLEVINGGQIQEWVKAGKVRSNCVEQCLICLEEYNSQDSVRVMECKHAFHMNCVDRWLLEGRNSCPACRGKGVSEESEARSS
ncbi:hypothetical protein GGU10DRAFT_341420 [Lentinula aff. detonsa]|uniref:RING-type domain-containing protein n=1 Tax=Lentinula aff. detonsa TaxID=2804958 RepID=A0AA38TZQ3_9AGAR|nr:hypothetical protein GGU10DRAFT_341420 [Lentinula aff. detonsa]